LQRDHLRILPAGVLDHVEGDPRQNYVPQISWAGGSDALFIQQSNRLQNAYNAELVVPALGYCSGITCEYCPPVFLIMSKVPTPFVSDQGR
jgi:hypothetical protein